MSMQSIKNPTLFSKICLYIVVSHLIQKQSMALWVKKSYHFSSFKLHNWGYFDTGQLVTNVSQMLVGKSQEMQETLHKNFLTFNQTVMWVVKFPGETTFLVYFFIKNTNLGVHTLFLFWHFLMISIFETLLFPKVDGDQSAYCLNLTSLINTHVQLILFKL